MVFPPPVTPHNMWDVSSPTRDGTSDPCIASSVFITGLPGKSLTQLLKAGSPPLSVLIWNTSKIHVNIQLYLHTQYVSIIPFVVVWSVSHVQLFCDPVDCSPPGSSVHGSFPGKIESGLQFPSPGDLPNPGINQTQVACISCIGRWILYP